tara:strand:+ start:6412 stop:7209 length:798 start_codon:yes stop_codon:yes gene_type:complete
MLSKQLPIGGASTHVGELDLLTKLNKASLTFRISTISVPPDPSPPLSSYYSEAGIIAVTGDTSSKRHFCYLLGGIPFSDVPDPGRHMVYEFHFNQLKETDLQDWEVLPSGLPKRVDGFALLGVLNKPKNAMPSSVSLGGEFPESDLEGSRFYGSSEGGMYVADGGDIQFVSEGGVTIKLGEDIDIGKTHIKGEAEGKMNLFIMQNPFHNGEAFGVPIPDVLPLSILTHNPTLNLPAIADAYVKIDGYKKLAKGIKEIIEIGETLV